MSALHVAHDIPGRLRLRLPPGSQTDRLPEPLLAEAGVMACRWSPRTASLLVFYDPQRTSRAALVDAVARLAGVDPAPESDAAASALEATEPGAAFVSGVRELFGDVDRRVQHATRGLIGLGGLFPAALTAWALTEIVRGRAAPLAWSSALWYAHGLFRDYQVPPARD